MLKRLEPTPVLADIELQQYVNTVCQIVFTFIHTVSGTWNLQTSCISQIGSLAWILDLALLKCAKNFILFFFVVDFFSDLFVVLYNVLQWLSRSTVLLLSANTPLPAYSALLASLATLALHDLLCLPSRRVRFQDERRHRDYAQDSLYPAYDRDRPSRRRDDDDLLDTVKHKPQLILNLFYVMCTIHFICCNFLHNTFFYVMEI